MPVQRPMTEHEKQARIMQFLQQKREQFTLTILNGLCSNPKTLEERVVVSSGAVSTPRSPMQKRWSILQLTWQTNSWRNSIPSRRRKASDLHWH